MPVLPEVELGKVCPGKLLKAFRANRKTAGSFDGWTPSELTHIPYCLVVWLARMLDRIEGGAAWPRDLLTIST
eukprot:6798513-Alexandrium_andersonii.AAC.1